MSECIICDGNNSVLKKMGFHIKEVDTFLSKGAFWLKNTDNSIWTFDYSGMDIDTIITESQSKMQNGVPYKDTVIYQILNTLVIHNISFAMWYDTYTDDLDICKSKEGVLETCYKQIMDISGMCEVYIVYLAENVK